MENQLTVVTWNYVREIRDSDFPDIKGVEYSAFKKQIESFLRTYHIIKMEDLVECLEYDKHLPSNPLLLTFDDGFKDHYEYVFPLLDKHHIQGSFFIPVKVMVEEKLLNVNKIHLILASVEDKSRIKKEIYDFIIEKKEAYKMKNPEDYYGEYAAPSKFDPPEIIFIKRILREGLAESVREELLNRIFNKFVQGTENERIWNKKYYLNEDQINCMLRHGMHIGVHGYDATRLSALNFDEQEKIIRRCSTFLETLEKKNFYKTISYPYGQYNSDTIKILEKYHFKAGFTNLSETTHLSKTNRFEIARQDNTDLEK